MPERNSGMTAVEILVVVGVLLVLAALVLVLAPGSEPAPYVEELWADETSEETGEPPPSQPAEEPVRKVTGASFLEFERKKTECMSNVRGLVSLVVATGGLRYPKHGGTDLILYLVKKGDIDGERNLGTLFCPGDGNESLDLVGGKDAYRDIDLNSDAGFGHLTSYAGRDIPNKGPEKKGGRTVVLVCDDSEDHHDGKGMVVGLSNGAVKWRDKVKHYKLPPDQKIEVGEGSEVPELKCMLAD
ncbi:MAG: hypothetical protein ACYSX0_11990 [Planctomycetota bacterium]|jgi:hypothetical protein